MAEAATEMLELQQSDEQLALRLQEEEERNGGVLRGAAPGGDTAAPSADTDGDGALAQRLQEEEDGVVPAAAVAAAAAAAAAPSSREGADRALAARLQAQDELPPLPRVVLVRREQFVPERRVRVELSGYDERARRAPRAEPSWWDGGGGSTYVCATLLADGAALAVRHAQLPTGFGASAYATRARFTLAHDAPLGALELALALQRQGDGPLAFFACKATEPAPERDEVLALGERAIALTPALRDGGLRGAVDFEDGSRVHVTVAFEGFGRAALDALPPQDELFAKYGGECAPDPEPRDEAEVPTPPRDATAADPPAPGASAPPEAEAEAPQHFD